MITPRQPVACAYEHTIATDKRGNLWGWGKNDSNQLGGYNVGAFCSSPQRIIDSIPPVHSVSCGFNHSAAIDLNKNIWTWGWNGQLGTTKSCCVTKLEHIPAMSEIACGMNHTVALDEFGRVWSWGSNTFYQLGVPTPYQFSSTPVTIQNIPTMIHISAGGNYTAALDTNHNIWVWGSLFESWNPNNLRRNLPQQLPTKFPILSISCGITHATAIDMKLNVLTWGQNNFKQLGILEEPVVHEPMYIPNLPPMKFISCGETATTAIDLHGKLWMWGKIWINRREEHSTVLTFEKPTPLVVPSYVAFQYVSSGTYHVTGMDKDGNIWSFGENDRGQLGLGDATPQLQFKHAKDLTLSMLFEPISKKSSRVNLKQRGTPKLALGEV